MRTLITRHEMRLLLLLGVYGIAATIAYAQEPSQGPSFFNPSDTPEYRAQMKQKYAQNKEKMDGAEVLVRQGNDLSNKGKFDKAIELYQQAMIIQGRVGPSSVGEGSVLADMGDAYLAKGDLKTAISWYDKIANPQEGSNVNQYNPRYLFTFALLLCQARRYSEAADIYLRASQRINSDDTYTPKLPERLTPLSAGMNRFQAACHLGLAAARENEHKVVFTECQTAVTLDPNFALAQLRFARALRESGVPREQFAQADKAEAEALHKAISLDRSPHGEVARAAKEYLVSWRMESAKP